MRLFAGAVCLIWFALGLAAALLAQVELAAPGVQFEALGDYSAYALLLGIHNAPLGVALPIAASFGLAPAALGDRGSAARRIGFGVLSGFGVLASVIVMLAAVGAAIPLLPSETRFDHFVRSDGVFVGASAVALSATLLMLVGPNRRPIVITLTLLAWVSLAVAAVMRATVEAPLGVDRMFHDTYVNVTTLHAAGGAVVLGGLAIAGSTLARSGRRVRLGWLALLSAAFFGGLAYIQARLGFDGMPRRYVDYAEAFEMLHRAAAVLGVGASVGFLICAAVLFLTALRPASR